jgi:predicted CxxxxCH...CXXCH cytochrome family protein
VCQDVCKPRGGAMTSHVAVRRTVSIAIAVLCAIAAIGCGGGAPSPELDSIQAKGQFGVFYLVTVFRPSNGFVTSQAPDARINCGPAGSGRDACGPARYEWTEVATLVATPLPGFGFQSWAGDCSTTGACVLTNGADKFIIAIFQPAGSVGHPIWTSPALHGPAYLDLLGGASGALNCATANCHGVNLQGAGLAPNCDTCHQQASWTAWRTNCSFCHGARTPAAKAGYVLAEHPDWSAPPDAIAQRLNGVPVPARTGAHQAHLSGISASGEVLSGPFRCETCHPVPANLSHIGGSTSRASVALAGAGQGGLPPALGTYAVAQGTCTTQCHGTVSPAWGSGAIACGTCHALPPPGPHPVVVGGAPRCSLCHPSSVKPDGTIDAAGTHVNGSVEIVGGGACDACHGFPPAIGAHRAHDGLSDATFVSGYGDLRTLQDRLPGATPANAPLVYGFGCGNCHALDAAKHMNGVTDVELYDATAAADSLKRLSSPAAAYSAGTGTCSGTYCHSSGQATPAFAVTPAWTSGTKLGCDGCHSNPPRYDSGGPGAATANSHLGFGDDAWEFGHFAGLMGPWHTSKHGGNYGPGEDSAPITCQTCHFDTTDPANAGPSGFYYLDTSGAYQLPGGNPARLGSQWYARLQCTSCHSAGSATAPSGTGKVRPLRHVNGSRDIAFDSRDALPAGISWLPAAPNTPTAPYWMTGGSTGLPWPADADWSGTTVSFSLRTSVYEPATKTCSNVACHLAEEPVWGNQMGSARCRSCHPLR